LTSPARPASCRRNERDQKSILPPPRSVTESAAGQIYSYY
jgi:hypothetical protein